MQRLIQTDYNLNKETKKVTHTTTAKKAVTNAISHLQENDYGANIVIVTDTETAELHAIIKMSPTGNISIVFKRDPKSPTCLMKEK